MTWLCGSALTLWLLLTVSARWASRRPLEFWPTVITGAIAGLALLATFAAFLAYSWSTRLPL